MNIVRGDRYERDGEEVYVVGVVMHADEYDTDEDEGNWSDKYVRLCRRWDDYGPVPTFWSEEMDEFIESVK